MSFSCSIDLNFPVLQVDFYGTTQNAGIINLNFPVLQVDFYGTTQNAGIIDLNFPVLQTLFEVVPSDTFVDITFPLLQVDMLVEMRELEPEEPEPEPEEPIISRGKQSSSYSPKIERKIYTINKNELITKSKILINDDEQVLNLIMNYIATLNLDEEEEAEFVIN